MTCVVAGRWDSRILLPSHFRYVDACEPRAGRTHHFLERSSRRNGRALGVDRCPWTLPGANDKVARQ